MSLTLAYEIARGGLMANSTLSSVVSRNIANVDNPNAARKSAATISTAMGVRLGTIGNSIASSLLESVLSNTSKVGQLGAVTTALERLAGSVGDPALGMSPAAMLTKMQSALYASAAEPNNEVLQRQVLQVAQDVVATSTAGDARHSVRKDANAGLPDSVQLETLLGDFERVNQAIVSAPFSAVTSPTRSTSATMLRELSGLIDIHPTTRTNNDMVLLPPTERRCSRQCLVRSASRIYRRRRANRWSAHD